MAVADDEKAPLFRIKSRERGAGFPAPLFEYLAPNSPPRCHGGLRYGNGRMSNPNLYVAVRVRSAGELMRLPLRRLLYPVVHAGPGTVAASVGKALPGNRPAVQYRTARGVAPYAPDDIPDLERKSGTT